MIPADVASRLRVTLPDQPVPTQPALPAQKLSDVLSDLVPGQRILAEIQALLPNGTYRAAIAQRDVTLALPFSAKAGDTLELEVVESDGKLTLAVVANRSGSEAPPRTSESSTTLSQAGRLISDLLGGIGSDGKRAPPAPLNANQPLISAFPSDAATLVPILRDALGKSGMFYEAHQARWVAGQLDAATLLQEPQSKHAPPGAGPGPAAAPALPQPTGTDQADARSMPQTPHPAPAATGTTTTAGIPADLVPLVQQQLDALGSQTYAWNGQIWSGQSLDWEIREETNGRSDSTEAAGANWQTRLKLTLPKLGPVEAVLRLYPGNTVELAIIADRPGSRDALAANGEALVGQFAAAGLNVRTLSVDHGQPAP